MSKFVINGKAKVRLYQYEIEATSEAEAIEQYLEKARQDFPAVDIDTAEIVAEKQEGE